MGFAFEDMEWARAARQLESRSVADFLAAKLLEAAARSASPYRSGQARETLLSGPIPEAFEMETTTEAPAAATAKFYRVALAAVTGAGRIGQSGVSGFLDGWGPGLGQLPSDATNLTAVSAGPPGPETHNLALLADGTVLAWGDNTYGQTNVPAGLTNAAAIAAGGRHSVALTREGVVVAWGDNSLGQTNIPAGLGPVVDIAAGSWHTLALKADGAVAAWGDLFSATGEYRASRHLPSFSLSDRVLFGGTESCFGGNCVPFPAQVTNAWFTNCLIFNAGLTDCVLDHCWVTNSSLANCRLVSCGLTNCLSSNPPSLITAFGALAGRTCLDESVPAGLSNVIGIAAGPRHCLALKSDRTLQAWGLDWAFFSNQPPVDIPAGLTNVSAISTGLSHNQALLQHGGLMAWGRTHSAPNTSEPGLDIPAGLADVAAMSAGWRSGAAIGLDGLVTGWGQLRPPFGLDGAAAISSSASHALVIRTNADGIRFSDSNPSAVAPLGGTLALFVTATSRLPLTWQWHRDSAAIPNATNCQLVLTNLQDSDQGEYWVQAANSVMTRCGPTNLVETVHPPQILTASPAPEVWLSGGESISLAVTINPKAVRTLRARIDSLTPVFPPLITITGATVAAQARAVSPPEGACTEFCRFILTNIAGAATSSFWRLSFPVPGCLVARGDNAFGQLPSSGAMASRTDFVAIGAGARHTLGALEDGTVLACGANDSGQCDTPAGLTNVIAVSGGAAHSLALASGAVTAWGDNSAGQCSVPASAASNVTAAAAGGSFSLALRTDGTVVAWGAISAPPSAASTNACALAAGAAHALILRRDGAVAAWGDNTYGQSAPPALAGVAQVAAGAWHSLALLSNGTVVAWGRNDAGQAAVPASLSGVYRVAAGDDFSVAIKADGSSAAWGADRLNAASMGASARFRPKAIACGGAHAVWLNHSPLINYPITVSQDLLLVYNAESPASTTVKDYYLAHRPTVGDARVLAVRVPATNTLDAAFETMTNSPGCDNSIEFTNLVQNPLLDWYAANPTIRPLYVVCFVDVPTRIPYVYPPNHFARSIPFMLHSRLGSLGGWAPLFTCIAMGGSEAALETDRVPDCINYIDKLARFGSNYAPGRVVIGPDHSRYSNTLYVLDDESRGMDYPNVPPSRCGGVMGQAVDALLAGGFPSAQLIYQASSTNRFFSATNLAGFANWGTYAFARRWVLDGRVTFYGDSSWYILKTIESYNGRRGTYGDQSNYTDWFNRQAFGQLNGRLNYENTPVGAVCHAGEPGGCCTHNAAVYFGRWNAGKHFVICAWESKNSVDFIAIGDPLVVR